MKEFPTVLADIDLILTIYGVNLLENGFFSERWVNKEVGKDIQNLKKALLSYLEVVVRFDLGSVSVSVPSVLGHQS